MNMMRDRYPQKANTRLLRSFAYALSGIGASLMRERNLRIHLAAGATALYAARFFSLSRAEWLVLILTVGFVPACELLNTAVEHAVNLVSLSRNPVAKAAKDTAAGAVLAAALTSLAVGVILFWDPPVLRAILGNMLAHPLPPAFWLGAALLWVFLPEWLQRRAR